MKLKQIMTKRVITLNTNDTLFVTIQKFAKKGIKGAPVTNSKKQVMGVVSNADLTNALNTMTPSIRITSSKLFSLTLASMRSKKEEDQIKNELKESKKIKVKSFMSDPITISQDASLMDAVKEMANANVNRLPVTNNNKLVGIITRSDLINALSNNFNE